MIYFCLITQKFTCKLNMQHLSYTFNRILALTAICISFMEYKGLKTMTNLCKDIFYTLLVS